MKKILTKFAVLAFSSATLLTSCNLDLFPEATQVYDPSQPFYYVAADVEGAHDAVYTYFRSISGGSLNYNSDLMFQGFNAVAGFGNRAGSIHRTDDTFTTSDEYVESAWGAYWSAIKNFNIFIEAAESAEGKDFESRAQYVKAEALIARAHSYLQLARLFAPAYSEDTKESLCVPLVLKYDQNARPHRATNEQVYEQIAQDLRDAREIFERPESSAMLTKEAPGAMYFTLDVISFLEARVLLDTGDYQAAADTAAAIIGRGKYSLSASAEALTALNTEDKGTEAIMQCYSSLDESSSSYSVFSGYAKDSNSPTGFSYSPDFLPSKVLLDSYDASDLRRQCWFELSGVSGDLAPVKNFNNGKYVSNINVFAKYKGNPKYNSGGIASAQVAAKPYLIGELYLIAAEGYFNEGNSTEANKFLAQLQSKRGAPITVANEKTINKEWFRETIGEGLYMSCLKRWGEGFEGRDGQVAAVKAELLTDTNDYYLKKVMSADDKALIWPIPAYELRCNPNLEQNEGWK